ncbi:MAG: transcription elongation factor Spt5 [Candidatus Woesearchaeota archaeon]
MPIFAVRTTSGREEQVIDFIVANVEKKNLPVYSIVYGHGMKGYIFVEAKDRFSVETAIFGVPYARGVLKKTVSLKDIEPMIMPEKVEYNIIKNDIVEIIAKPFKGEKGKVKRVDLEKGQVIVELLNAIAPLPITLSIDNVRLVRRESSTEVVEEGKRE